MKSCDIDGDGQLELFHFHPFTTDSSMPAQYRLTCRDGQSGSENWHYDIVLADWLNHSMLEPDCECRMSDIDGDGGLDVLLPSFNRRGHHTLVLNGKTGKPIWKSPPTCADGKTAFGWQSEVIHSPPTDSAVLAAAWETPDKTIQMDFFDLQQKTRISTWSTNCLLYTSPSPRD